jgi:hypothetical protein
MVGSTRLKAMCLRPIAYARCAPHAPQEEGSARVIGPVSPSQLGKSGVWGQSKKSQSLWRSQRDCETFLRAPIENKAPRSERPTRAERGSNSASPVNSTAWKSPRLLSIRRRGNHPTSYVKSRHSIGPLNTVCSFWGCIGIARGMSGVPAKITTVCPDKRENARPISR